MPSVNPPQLQQRGLPAELDKYARDVATALNLALVKGDTYRVVQAYTQAKPLVVPTDWTAVSFLNSWANFNAASWDTCAYKKDALGFVHIKGHVASGTLGQPIFVLPVGYRPVLTQQFAVMSNNVFGLCTVESTTGNVKIENLTGNTNSFCTLHGITFQASDFSPGVASCFPFDVPWDAPASPSLVLAQVQDVANAAIPANLALCNVDWIPVNQAGAITSNPSLLRIRNIPGLRPGSYAVQVVTLQ